VVYGASGYTGKLILEYIYQHVEGAGHRRSRSLLAGRTPAKLHARLDEIKQKFPDVAYAPDVLRADIADALRHPRDSRSSARCVLNVAGPFMNTNAHLLVQACLEYDCDYVDVNGEVPFTHKLVGLHDYAKKRRVIVCPNAAGAGGLPDVAAFFAAGRAARQDGRGHRVGCTRSCTATAACPPAGRSRRARR